MILRRGAGAALGLARQTTTMCPHQNNPERFDKIPFLMI
jgi:hypothetical protein